MEPSLHRVTGPDGPTRVEPKVLEVLARLAATPGEVVSRETLLEEVWGGVEVSEGVVRRAVYELRKLLGDDAEAPHYLETIPRSGYRLIAAVDRGEPRGRAQPAEEAGARPRPSSSRRLARGWLPAAIAAAAVLVLLEAPAGRRETERLFRLTPFTAYSGLEYDPAFSPDGSRIAFVRAGNDGSEPTLCVRLVGSDPAFPLAADGESPAWSPDGRYVTFVHRVRRPEGPRREIREVPWLGGASRRLLADLGERRPYGLARSPDGRRLAFGWSEDGETPYGIYLLDPATGDRRRLTHPPAGTGGDGEPAWSPDGETLAFVHNTYGSIQDIFTVPARGGEAHRITPASRKIPDVVWSPDGRRLFYTVQETGDHRLWSIPADGSGPGWAMRAGEGDHDPDPGRRRPAPRLLPVRLALPVPAADARLGAGGDAAAAVVEPLRQRARGLPRRLAPGLRVHPLRRLRGLSPPAPKAAKLDGSPTSGAPS